MGVLYVMCAYMSVYMRCAYSGCALCNVCLYDVYMRCAYSGCALCNVCLYECLYEMCL